MKLWIARAEQYDYDQYDGFLIRAETEQEAHALVAIETGVLQAPIQTWHLQPVSNDGPACILLGSFNAG
jgi:hypothetical protein